MLMYLATLKAAVLAWMRHPPAGNDGMVIPRVMGKRQEMWRIVAQRSQELRERYRRGEVVPDDCPLMKALKGVQS